MFRRRPPGFRRRSTSRRPRTATRLECRQGGRGSRTRRLGTSRRRLHRRRRLHHTRWDRSCTYPRRRSGRALRRDSKCWCRGCRTQSPKDSSRRRKGCHRPSMFRLRLRLGHCPCRHRHHRHHHHHHHKGRSGRCCRSPRTRSDRARCWGSTFPCPVCRRRNPLGSSRHRSSPLPRHSCLLPRRLRLRPRRPRRWTRIHTAGLGSSRGTPAGSNTRCHTAAARWKGSCRPAAARRSRSSLPARAAARPGHAGPAGHAGHAGHEERARAADRRGSSCRV